MQGLWLVISHGTDCKWTAYAQSSTLNSKLAPEAHPSLQWSNEPIIQTFSHSLTQVDRPGFASLLGCMCSSGVQVRDFLVVLRYGWLCMRAMEQPPSCATSLRSQPVAGPLLLPSSYRVAVRASHRVAAQLGHFTEVTPHGRQGGDGSLGVILCACVL